MNSDRGACLSGQSTHRDATEVGLLPLGSAVLWMSCLAVGAIGLWIPYPRLETPAKEQSPVEAQLMHVDLTNDASLAPDIRPPPASASPLPPAPPENISVPPAPQLAPVAIPTAAIALARPTEAPSRVVQSKDTASTHFQPAATTAPSSPTAVAAAAQPTHLTFGQGEGSQPAPEYPREARMARQQGTVVIQFTVGEDGRVQTAKALTPSPFALLNQAALRTVRENWRFRSGAVRSYEVSIQFELRQR